MNIKPMRTIKLKKMVGAKIAHRYVVENFFKDIQSKYPEENTIMLNFRGITDISRSAAHQFKLETSQNSSNNKDFKFKNQNKEVKKIFELVHKSNSNRLKTTYNKLSFKNQDQFFEYLSTL
jgi:anti-anti-sigma regulatory factor